MIKIASQLQSVRLMEILESSGDVDHYEMENTDAEAVDLHVKEFRLDGSVHNFFISTSGSLIKGGVGMRFVVPATDKSV